MDERPARTMGPHGVYWGSHGCTLATVHAPGTECECRCCSCDGAACEGYCVAKWPYYGPETRFYGADAERFGLPLAE